VRESQKLIMRGDEEERMQEYHFLERIRNIGIIAHIDAGKTTTSERILYYTGKIHRVGEVHEGTTVMDWMVQERERGITITLAATTCLWNDYQINIIDTPGHVDFTVEVERTLRVLDGVVIIFCAVGGVEPQSETVWRQANRYRIPRVIFINKLDRMGADFSRVINQIKKKFSLLPLLVQLPLGEEDNFRGIIDVVKMKAFEWESNQPEAKIIEKKIPSHLYQRALYFHRDLAEKAAESSDELLEKFLEKGNLKPEEIMTGIRILTLAHQGVPVFCGSALKNKGIRLLLKGIIDYLPSPLDVPPVEGVNPLSHKREKRLPSLDEPLSALAFKVVTDPYVGRLTYVRIYSGRIKRGCFIYDPLRDSRERITRILEMHANYRKEKNELCTGDIGAVIGPAKIETGDSLCSEDHPLLLESIRFAQPVISVAIEPRSKAEQDRLSLVLSKLMQEDPTFKVKQDTETGQTIISGMGQLHLDIILDRLKREFGVKVNVGKPQVAYKETLRRESRARGQYIRQSGGKGQYGDVYLQVEPGKKGEEFFVDKSRGGVIPKQFIPAIKKAIKQSMLSGVMGSYPVVNVRTILLDGSYHPVDSSEYAFKAAASIAFRKASQEGDPYLLEPVMKLEIRVPHIFLGEVIKDITSRRGQIVKTESEQDIHYLVAHVPLAELFGYVTRLRSLTRGKAIHNLEFFDYQEMPPELTKKVLG